MENLILISLILSGALVGAVVALTLLINKEVKNLREAQKDVWKAMATLTEMVMKNVILIGEIGRVPATTPVEQPGAESLTMKGSKDEAEDNRPEKTN
jgi:gas vesicle protein